MIAVVRTRTLHALRASRSEAETATAAARAEAEQHQLEGALATDSAIRAESAVEELRAALARTIADAARLEGEVETLRAQSLLDTEDRQALRMLLRTTRKQSTRADRVYVLYRLGEMHSVHATRDAAEIAAEAEGAARDGWTSSTTCCDGFPAPASEVPWRIRPVPLGGTR
ncbi:hypothetical protein [Streptomyces sp. Ncost-T10-10d]|uniref:hypothetical protein n=1 Tax=Streptomyces sp. Ncost-T10-10d TaxID=1839774 RepID=UPI00081D83B1|nr:hypothetical protein [Streptomyces sp. Ncost-T10-10d]SCF79653.1 hypothetical protein GA0115254_117320 [Streptomyces sp. Ncost-T10-10d]